MKVMVWHERKKKLYGWLLVSYALLLFFVAYGIVSVVPEDVVFSSYIWEGVFGFSREIFSVIDVIYARNDFSSNHLVIYVVLWWGGVGFLPLGMMFVYHDIKSGRFVVQKWKFFVFFPFYMLVVWFFVVDMPFNVVSDSGRLSRKFVEGEFLAATVGVLVVYAFYMSQVAWMVFFMIVSGNASVAISNNGK